jgi:hypothetical protein
MIAYVFSRVKFTVRNVDRAAYEGRGYVVTKNKVLLSAKFPEAAPQKEIGYGIYLDGCARASNSLYGNFWRLCYAKYCFT